MYASHHRPMFITLLPVPYFSVFPSLPFFHVHKTLYQQKMKKPKSTQSETEIDLISNLPDPVLHLILSGIPTTEEVVRTSILSTRWRYLWTSIPSVNIDFTRKRSPHFNVDNFKEFVYWVLLNKTLDLDSFQLCCRNRFNLSTVCRWIHVAVMRKVKSLNLRFFPRDENETVELPHSLVTCDSLEALCLFLYFHPLTLPTFAGFSTLRVLELNHIKLLDAGSINNFFTSCPLLEELSLLNLIFQSIGVLSISCLNLKTLRIDNGFLRGDYIRGPKRLCRGLNISCPKLVYLEYAGDTARNFSFENLGSLKKAVINPELLFDIDSFRIPDSMCELFGFVSHVKSLSINRYFIECISSVMVLNADLPASLPNLKILEMSIRIDTYTMFGVTRILKCCPNLESLHLSIRQGIFLDEECWSDKVLALHLKRVEFVDFMSEGKQNLELVQFLLEHGNELEEVVFSWPYKEIYDTESKKTLERVSSFKRASSTVKLVGLLKA